MDIFANQARANEIYFVDNRPKLSLKPLEESNGLPHSLQNLKGEVHDITSCNARSVVALMSIIVNRGAQEWTPNKTFYLLINGKDFRGDLEVEYEEIFRIQARPARTQPGNGVVVMRPRRKVRIPHSAAKDYDQLNGALEAFYKTDTTAFVRHLEELFYDNKKIHDVPAATAEAYALLLYEIARRLVRPIVNDAQKELDTLPIGSAIARVMNLLFCKACTFEEFFLGCLRCFTGKASARRKAIDSINDLYLKTFKKLPVSEESCLEELKEMFGEDQEQGAAAGFKKSQQRVSGEDEFMTQTHRESQEMLQLFKKTGLHEAVAAQSSSGFGVRKLAESKHRKFVTETMEEKPVTEIAGIGKYKLGLRLKHAGFDKAYMVVGIFLLSKKGEDSFKQWLKKTSGANDKEQRECFNCLQELWNNFGN